MKKIFNSITKISPITKYVFILFTYLAIHNYSVAQVNITLGNQKTIGGSESDLGVSIQKLGDGYVCLIESKSTVSFDRTVTLKGNFDFWLVGLTTTFQPKWQKSFGGSKNDEARDMIVTDSKDIIIVGRSDSPISGNKTVANYGNGNVWVICTDSVGVIKWQKIYGGAPGENFSMDIIEIGNGRFVIGTTSYSGISGTKSEPAIGGGDYWIFCIDSVGNQLWDKTIGGSKYDRLSSIMKISESELLISGVSNSSISGDKTEDNIINDTNVLGWESRDIWLVKYNFLKHQIVWDRTLGGIDEEGMVVVSAFADGFIYTSTMSLSGISGTKTVASYGKSDIWINKLDTSGNVIWNKAYGGSGSESPNCFSKQEDNMLLLGGGSDSPISGNKSENQVGGYYPDYWLVSIDTTGYIIWDKTIGGDYSDEAISILAANKNNIVVLGNSTSSISGHKTEPIRGTAPPYGAPDVWIVELMTNVGIENNKFTSSIEVFPNPSQGIINIELISPTDEIQNVILFSIEGKEIMNIKLSSNQTEIDLSNIPPGIYLLEGKTKSGNIFRKKLIKN